MLVRHGRGPFTMILRGLSGFMVVGLLSGCAGFLSGTGPRSAEIQEAGESDRLSSAISVVDINSSIVADLLQQVREQDFATTWPELDVAQENGSGLGPGDVIELSVWEAAPATLFGMAEGQAEGSIARVQFPLTVGSNGRIKVPFIGEVRARGRELAALEREIQRRYSGIANNAQVIATRSLNQSSLVTVIGEVGQSQIMPVGLGSNRILEVLAGAGGAKVPVNKASIQLSRAGVVRQMPLSRVLNEQQQNIRLEGGDILAVRHQPNSLVIMGGTAQSAEIDFEFSGISLSQALARAGGLVDDRANPSGIFVFRAVDRGELNDAPDLTTQTALPATAKQVPVVYRVNLKDPAGIFLAQSFPMRHGDVIYVSNAPAADLQKFLRLIVSTIYPITSILNLPN